MLLAFLKSNWRTLSQTGAWLVGTVSVFVFPPPIEVGSDSSSTFRFFAAFVLAAVVGVLALPFSHFKRHGSAVGWAVISLVLLMIGTTLFFSYQDKRRILSAEYSRGRVVVGRDLTLYGKQYMDAERPSTTEQAVFDAGGQPALIWTSDSIHANAQVLHRLYFFVVISLSLSALTAIQSRYCALRPVTPQYRNTKRVAARRGR